MLLFDKQPLVCYLTSGSLAVFEANNKQILMFSPSNIVYGEIVDERKYREDLQKFFKSVRVKEKKGIIVLSSELVFFKEFKAPYKIIDEVENFLTKVPLTGGDIAVIYPHNASKLQILAVNRKFYETIIEALENNGIKIFSVVPAPVLPREIKNILREKKIIEKYNFLQSKQHPEVNKTVKRINPQDQSEEKKNMKKQYILLTITLLLLASAIVYLLLWLKKPI